MNRIFDPVLLYLTFFLAVLLAGFLFGDRLWESLTGAGTQTDTCRIHVQHADTKAFSS